jgi:hypothetical protein
MTPPRATKVALSFSASSLGMFSLRTLGSDSTNFFASMSVRFGTSDLTSLMILGLAAASNDSSLTLKIVFSFGFSCGGIYQPCEWREEKDVSNLCWCLLRGGGGCGCCWRSGRHGNLLNV